MGHADLGCTWSPLVREIFSRVGKVRRLGGPFRLKQHMGIFVTSTLDMEHVGGHVGLSFYK